MDVEERVLKIWLMPNSDASSNNEPNTIRIIEA
jgi:hypothetical protein